MVTKHVDLQITLELAVHHRHVLLLLDLLLPCHVLRLSVVLLELQLRLRTKTNPEVLSELRYLPLRDNLLNARYQHPVLVQVDVLLLLTEVPLQNVEDVLHLLNVILHDRELVRDVRLLTPLQVHSVLHLIERANDEVDQPVVPDVVPVLAAIPQDARLSVQLALALVHLRELRVLREVELLLLRNLLLQNRAVLAAVPHQPLQVLEHLLLVQVRDDDPRQNVPHLVVLNHLVRLPALLNAVYVHLEQTLKVGSLHDVVTARVKQHRLQLLVKDDPLSLLNP